MIRDGHEDVTLFTGVEVEHTPAYGKKTLFVVGVPQVNKIINTAQQLDIDHIYLGANMSFPNLGINDAEKWAPWETAIWALLDANFWVTLDFDISQVEGVIESCFTERRRFIPVISAKLPYINQLGYNAVLKIDDKDFDSTNPGVWCHQLHNLMNKETFTNWDKYLKDEPHAIE